MNQEVPDVQAGFRKGRGTRDQIANIRWIIEKAREFQKNIYFCFINFDCEDHNKLWKILKEMGIPRPSYLPPEKPVCRSRSNRTGHGTMDWFKVEKGVHQGCILPPLFNFYAEYVIWYTRLDEAQAGIKTARRNINNLRLQMTSLWQKAKRN